MELFRYIFRFVSLLCLRSTVYSNAANKLKEKNILIYNEFDACEFRRLKRTLLLLEAVQVYLKLQSEVMLVTAKDLNK